MTNWRRVSAAFWDSPSISLSTAKAAYMPSTWVRRMLPSLTKRSATYWPILDLRGSGTTSARGVTLMRDGAEIICAPGKVEAAMQDWVWIILFVVGYVALTQWLLPKLGVST